LGATKFIESTLGDYSYIASDSDVIYTKIEKFCSIAAMVRINPGNHPMHRATQSHFTYRASAYFDGEADEDEFFEWRRSHPVNIGHDVWIGHGAVVSPDANRQWGNHCRWRSRDERRCALYDCRRHSGKADPATLPRHCHCRS